ncbi:hypothetical protein AVEN_160309-1 [Araneus ventricosus]|uniref:Uncharacterized protein n=1 Tax=Araneus ventricosus TaxID=182803 RepID=A0A4Y2FC87_ARAVE|nr:hypothetical protein AVEN_160309-1 [Araneus ventricosus]
MLLPLSSQVPTTALPFTQHSIVMCYRWNEQCEWFQKQARGDNFSPDTITDNGQIDSPVALLVLCILRENVSRHQMRKTCKHSLLQCDSKLMRQNVRLCLSSASSRRMSRHEMRKTCKHGLLQTDSKLMGQTVRLSDVFPVIQCHDQHHTGCPEKDSLISKLNISKTKIDRGMQ